MKKVLVGSVVPGDDILGTLVDIIQKIRDGVLTPEQLKRFAKKENPFDGTTNWLDGIVSREKTLHRKFFGSNFAKKFDYSPFFEILEKYGEAKINEWQDLGLEPHFLPSVTMSQDRNFLGWKIKPEQWFYDQIAGNVLGDPLNLGGQNGQVVLVDIRCKPAYSNGEQMWQNDNLLGEIISGLRARKEIVDYNPKNSRFGVSALEIEQKIAPLLAQKLGLSGQVRLEKAIEFNAFSQILADTPRTDDGKTNTWLWFADHFNSSGHRLNGGSSGYGGLAHVHYYCADNHSHNESFRLVVVLV